MEATKSARWLTLTHVCSTSGGGSLVGVMAARGEGAAHYVVGELREIFKAGSVCGRGEDHSHVCG